MRAKDNVFYRVTYDYEVPSGQLIGQLGPYASYWDSVDPLPMNPGNRHDPTRWAYTILQEQGAKGELFRHESGGSDHKYAGYLMAGSTWRCGLFDWQRTLMYNRALEKLNSKVRGNLDLAVDLAEGGQTMRMIRGVRNVLDFARSRAWNTRALANGWLQWQYGWRPLISDVYDACDQSSRAVRRSLTKVTGSATQPIRVNEKFDKWIINAYFPHVRNIEGKQSCRIVLTLEPLEGWGLELWTSLNPVSLAWELIPYSFVVDWFVDVGSYLRNLETALLYRTRFVSGYSSELCAFENTETGIPSGNVYTSGDAYSRLDSAVARVRWARFWRLPLTSYPFPRPPTFKVDLGSQRLFSAAALLRQLLK